MKISIIGGYGDTGGFFARLFAEEGFEVTITGPSREKGEAFAKENKVAYEQDNKKATIGADVVIVSVPIDRTSETISEVAPEMKPGSLLMDLTSIKEEPCRLMAKKAPMEVEVIGAHPMFSHRVGGIEGQVMILTPIRGERYLPWLRELLEGKKARVYETSPGEHDKMMAVVQGLTHFAYIAIGKTLKDLDFDVGESLKYSSPVYELMLDIVGRIIGQNPELYASIQMDNPYVSDVHARFLESAEDLRRTVLEKDRERFKSTMTSAAAHFGDVEEAMNRSDKAISSLLKKS